MGDVDYVISVKTGDRLFSGTDANVYVRLCCNNGNKSEEKLLDRIFINDLETGQVENFYLKDQVYLPSIDYIEIWRDDTGILDNWYVDFIKVKNTTSDAEFEFPVFRWLKAHFTYRIVHLDTSLPQNECFSDQRKMELSDKKIKYEVSPKIVGGPAQVYLMLFFVRAFIIFVMFFFLSQKNPGFFLDAFK